MFHNRCWTILLFLSMFFGGSSFLAVQLPSNAGDWPAWRGPDRTDLSKEKGLLQAWPQDGPGLLWKTTGLGAGFSTPSVAGGRIFLLGARGKEELLIALEVQQGQRLWATPAGYREHGRFNQPERSSQRAWPHPVIAGGRLYLRDWDVLLCYDVKAQD
jgi:hypothetical protein